MEQHLPRMLFAPVALVPGPQAHLSYGLGKIMKVKVGELGKIQRQGSGFQPSMRPLFAGESLSDYVILYPESPVRPKDLSRGGSSSVES